jgi:hypothetical protein
MVPVSPKNSQALLSAPAALESNETVRTDTFVASWFVQTELSDFFFLNLVEASYNFLDNERQCQSE